MPISPALDEKLPAWDETEEIPLWENTSEAPRSGGIEAGVEPSAQSLSRPTALAVPPVSRPDAPELPPFAPSPGPAYRPLREIDRAAAFVNRNVIDPLLHPIRTAEHGIEGIASLATGKNMKFLASPSEALAVPAIPPELVEFFIPFGKEKGTVQEGVRKFAGQFISGLTSPEMAFAVSAAKIYPELVGRAFQVQMATSVPAATETLWHSIRDKAETPDQVVSALSVLAAAGLPVAIERGLRARAAKEFQVPEQPTKEVTSAVPKQETAEVLRDVPEQPRPVAEEVPAETGPARVPRGANAPAEEVPLTEPVPSSPKPPPVAGKEAKPTGEQAGALPEWVSGPQQGKVYRQFRILENRFKAGTPAEQKALDLISDNEFGTRSYRPDPSVPEEALSEAYTRLMREGGLEWSPVQKSAVEDIGGPAPQAKPPAERPPAPPPKPAEVGAAPEPTVKESLTTEPAAKAQAEVKEKQWTLERVRERFKEMVGPRATDKAIESVPQGIWSAITTGKFNDMMDPTNKTSRRIFEEVTGIKLPSGLTATKKLFKGKSFLLESPPASATPSEPTRAPEGKGYVIGEPTIVERQYGVDITKHKWPGNKVIVEGRPDLDVSVYKAKSGWIVNANGRSIGKASKGVGQIGFDTPKEAVENYLRTLTRTPEGEAELSRIASKGKKFDPFTAEEGDLADFFEERFGEQARGGVAGEARGIPAFRDYAEFRDWMEKAYSAADLDALKTGFALADTKQKIQLIRDNRASDATKREVITHLATGAPLPAGFKPVVPAAPRPMPGTAGPPPPTRPGQPAPPPRPSPNVPHHRKFDITALVQLFRQFSKFPTVNERLMQAYGRFVPGSNAVELKARLMWDTKLAERVLGHEIGHFIDLAVVAMGKGKQFAKRLIPLWDLRRQIWTKTELKNEARSLSREWRGPFTNGDRYRDSAKELFADYMSAMFNNPEMVNQKFPKLFDAFQQLREGKPQFASAYREIETWLQGDTMVDEIRVQDKSAVNRTFDELQNPRQPSKASFADRLKFATLSLWQRAFEKEGKPRKLGTSVTDELEYNKTWAAKENALFADDFSKTVRPELEKVNTDPVQSRADLLSYSKAVRTIGERRASGKWIEDNPVEARQMLERILELSDTLRAKFSADLRRAADTDLYDLSAAIFREIHDGGERFVNRMTRAIDELDLGIGGEAALMAFNVRGKLLNPGGMTVENSQKMIDRLRDDLGHTRFSALETAAKNLRDLLHDVQSKMHDEGLISDKIWKELIEPNKDNYLPYAVLDYFDGKVRAGVMPQKGTAKDIADIAAATQLKVASSNVWRQQQRQVQLLRDAYAKGGLSIPLGEKLKRSRDLEQVKQKHLNDDTSRAVLWADGKPHVVEFPGDKGKLLEKAMDVPAFYEHIEWISEASDMTHKVMQFYTQFSVPFLFWRNPIRGARTAGLKVGFGKVARQMTPAELAENARLAKNYAEAAFGGEMDPVIRDLVDRQILLPPRLSQAMVRDSANLRDLLANHTVLANQVRGLHPNAQPRWWKGGAVGRKGIEISEKVFTAYEAFEKIYNYKAAIEKGLTPEQAGAVARRAGIPKPGVGGKWSLAMEVWFPWTRVHIQGTRATYDMLRDPTMRKGFAARFALTEAMPRVAKVAIGTGIASGAISWVIGNHEDDPKDGVMAEFMRRVSPYKMALDDTVPLYFYDARTGKVHYLWEFKNGKSIPEHYEAVSLRIPASEEGRLWGVLLYNAMVSAPGVSEKLGKPGETFVSNMGNWAVNYAAPGLSPIITTTSNLKDMLLLGRNPKDAYRNQPAANPKLFDAGGVDRAQAVAGYTLNQLGSAGELAGVMAANFGLLDERALNALSTRLPGDYRKWNERVPFLKTAISHDNYALYREEKIPALEEERIRAKARLVMSSDVRALYDFYYRNLNRKDKLTASEQKQFSAANYFVNQIWGKLTINKKPTVNSFYSKAAHAVGKDGSSQSKETVKRDLDSASAGALAAFKKARYEDR